VKLKEIRETTKKLEDGAWVQDLPNLPGVAIKARGTFNSDYNRLFQKLRNKLNQAELMDDTVNEEIETQLLVETILLDWKGIDDAPFDKAKVADLLREPELAVLRRACVYAGNVVVREGKAELETTTKN
jgi:hypothetical protein